MVRVRCETIFTKKQNSLGRWPFKYQPPKMVKTHCLSVFDHFMGLAVKGLSDLVAELTCLVDMIQRKKSLVGTPSPPFRHIPAKMYKY